MMFNDYVVIDIETSGLDPEKDEIIELGAVRVRQGEIVACFSSLVCPMGFINDEIAAITGITNEVLGSMPLPSVAYRSFVSLMGFGNNLVGHNVGFDLAFVNRLGIKCTGGARFTDKVMLIGDTKELWQEMYPGHSSHLMDIAMALGITFPHPPHRALNDCLCTHMVWQALKARQG